MDPKGSLGSHLGSQVGPTSMQKSSSFSDVEKRRHQDPQSGNLGTSPTEKVMKKQCLFICFHDNHVFSPSCVLGVTFHQTQVPKITPKWIPNRPQSRSKKVIEKTTRVLSPEGAHHEPPMPQSVAKSYTKGMRKVELKVIPKWIRKWPKKGPQKWPGTGPGTGPFLIYTVGG